MDKNIFYLHLKKELLTGIQQNLNKLLSRFEPNKNKALRAYLQALFFYILISGGLISCFPLDWADSFLTKSNFRNNYLSSQPEEKEPLKEEILELAKNSVWEVSLYLNFQTRQIDFSTHDGALSANVEPSYNFINLGHGSGFFIAPKRMITNFHVIDSTNEHIEIISNRDSENSKDLLINKMKVLKVSSLYDLALLESETESPYFLDLKQEKINLNKDSFFLLGYPDNRFILSLVQYNSSQLGRKLFLFNRKAELGNLTGASGGPIIDQKGEVVAVNQSGSDEISIGISHSIVHRFLSGDNRDCSEISLEECLQEEWLLLDRAYRNGESMAKHRISVNKSYEHWLNKKEALSRLIENRQRLNQLEEELASALERYSREKNAENKNFYQSVLERYENQIEAYNENVAELNRLFL